MQEFLRAYGYLFAALTILDELGLHLPAAHVSHSMDYMERSEMGLKYRDALEAIRDDTGLA